MRLLFYAVDQLQVNQVASIFNCWEPSTVTTFELSEIDLIAQNCYDLIVIGSSNTNIPYHSDPNVRLLHQLSEQYCLPLYFIYYEN